MASRTLTWEILTAAAQEYCSRKNLICSEGTDNGVKRLLIDPGNLKVALIDGKIAADSDELNQALAEIIMDMPSESPKKNLAPVNTVAPISRAPGPITPQDIINYINPKATELEAHLFAEYCKRKGADPMTKQVYLAIFENEKGERNVSFIAGKEYFTEKAEAHPQFDGLEAGIIVRPKEGGNVVHREGTFYVPSEEMLLGGWAMVYRKDRKIQSKSEVLLAEYNTGKRNWSKMPGTMIRKVAIVQALREAFPANFGGMYDKAEMDKAIDVEAELVS